jgi:glycine/D-amino acid oxidase-like deaminating enzyme
LPFKPAKGEVLLVRIKDYPANEKLVKHGVFIVHWQDDLYWIGSSYDRDFVHVNPTQTERENLEKRLSEVLKLPYEVVEHQAAIRPTVRDRRPYLGQHPSYQPLYIFNGMGAKGSYLVPYFAKQMVDFLECGKELDKTVDINRVKQSYY